MKKEIVMVIVLTLLAVPLAGCLGGNTSPSPTPGATKNTSIVLNSTTIVQGSPIAISASLNSDGQLLNNKTILWLLNNQSLRNTTTVNGTATLRLTAFDTSQFSVGTNLLKAEFNGDDTYSQSNATAVLTVTAASPIPAIQNPAIQNPAIVPTAVPTYTPANAIPTVPPQVTRKPVITVS
jgi:hypothetical protein